MSYQVIKLSNGEDIVCRVHKNTSTAESNKLKISSPLRMDTVSKETEKGFYLYTNREKQKLIINNGKIQNNLNERQLDFVKDYIKL